MPHFVPKISNIQYFSYFLPGNLRKIKKLFDKIVFIFSSGMF